MDDGGCSAYIIISFVVLLFIEAVLQGFGQSIRMLNEKDVEANAVDGKNRKYTYLLELIKNPTICVNTLVLVETLVILLFGYAYLPFWVSAFEDLFSFLKLSPNGIHIVSLVVSIFLLMYCYLIFGYLFPKKLAKRHPEQWAYIFIKTIKFLEFILYPLTGVVAVTTNFILRILGLRSSDEQADVTEEEIISMVNEGHEQGVLQASEAEMITNIFEFGDKEAKDIMTHRKHINAIDGDTPLKEAISFMLSHSNSRYPVYEENIDHVIGILHLKDAMRIHDNDARINVPIRKIKGLVREVKVIPETRNIDVLFKMMQSTKTQMVVVIDEYGQTAGLIAMEDILEEIVGNIQDEYDEDEKYIEQKSEDEYIIDGKTPLDELEERLQISFEEEEFETLNGFLISKMERIPKEDEQFSVDVGGYNFKILTVENKMISSVLVTKLPEEVSEKKENAGTDVEEKPN